MDNYVKMERKYMIVGILLILTILHSIIKHRQAVVQVLMLYLIIIL